MSGWPPWPPWQWRFWAGRRCRRAWRRRAHPSPGIGLTRTAWSPGCGPRWGEAVRLYVSEGGGALDNITASEAGRIGHPVFVLNATTGEVVAYSGRPHLVGGRPRWYLCRRQALRGDRLGDGRLGGRLGGVHVGQSRYPHQAVGAGLAVPARRVRLWVGVLCARRPGAADGGWGAAPVRGARGGGVSG